MTSQRKIDALVDQTAQELFKAGFDLDFEDIGFAFDRACDQLKVTDDELTDDFYDDFRDTWALFLKSKGLTQK